MKAQIYTTFANCKFNLYMLKCNKRTYVGKQCKFTLLNTYIIVLIYQFFVDGIVCKFYIVFYIQFLENS